LAQKLVKKQSKVVKPTAAKKKNPVMVAAGKQAWKTRLANQKKKNHKNNHNKKTQKKQ
jgi:hypothetical protein